MLRRFPFNNITFHIKLPNHGHLGIYSTRIKAPISLRRLCALLGRRSGMSSTETTKETPKKVYKTPNYNFDLSSCRICGGVGDPSHRKNLFKTQNQALLKIAEHLCEHPIVRDSGLPHLLCRPCERRLNNCLELQKVIQKTEDGIRQRQAGGTRVKRCIDVSPSISKPPKSRASSTSLTVSKSTAPTARQSLSFGLNVPETPGKEVRTLFY